jgi:LGFP repeat
VDINSSGARGAQFGDGNAQFNVWVDGRRLDAAFIGELNPRKSAELVNAMEHDDAVLLLARADVDAGAAALDVLLRRNEALVVSLLADISERRSAALITKAKACAPGREWLGYLCEAAEAIGSRAAELKWSDPGPLEHIALAGPGLDAHTYRRTYQNGHIHWRFQSCWAVTPVTAIEGMILDHYMGSGGIRGRFGAPLSEKRPVGPTCGDRWVQSFSGGVVYQHEASVIEVDWRVARYMLSRSDAYQRYPLSPATEAPDSPYGTRGRMQRFQGSWDSCDETVYYSAGTGPCGVRGEIAGYYDRLGATSSWLGFPTGQPNCLNGYLTQDFEGGTVFAWLDPLSGRPAGSARPDWPVAVPAASLALIRCGERTRGRLGLPVTAEEPTGTGGDSWQFFQNGVITVKDGKRQVWLRP